jgi:SAM-dependent methyltransferase
MMQTYAIKGGESGRERLRVLSHIRQGATLDLLDQIGVRPGMSCLDVGCGGGEVSRELARRVGASGRVVGLDMDLAQLEIVRTETVAQKFLNIDYCVGDAAAPPSNLGRFDVVYTRFLLCHLKRPSETLSWMVSCLKPGGVLAIEDCDFSGYFCHPPSPAFDRYVELTAKVMRRRGGDPYIGLKLPSMLLESGLAIGGVAVTQPSDIVGEVKLLSALSMENVADAVLADGLANRDEVERLVVALHEIVHDPRTFASVARAIQVWGRSLK